MVFRAELKWQPGKLIAAKEKAKKRNLIRAGAIVRRRMRSGLRRRKRISQPGERPSIHGSRSKNLRFILFLYDERTRSVVVGPVKFSGGTDAPSVLEKGGTATIRRRRKPKDRRRSKRVVRVRVKPRPYAVPALEESKEAIGPKIWKNSIVA